MAITYSYDIQSLKQGPAVDGLEQVITQVDYTYTGTDENGVTSNYPGRTTLPPPNSELFTPITELTPEIVISWLEDNADLIQMRKSIDYHIEQQAGVIYRGHTLPWALPVEEIGSPIIPEV